MNLKTNNNIEEHVMQRIVKTLTLKDDPELIGEYRRVHENIWPEIRNGILEVGVTTMDIYLLGNLLVMFVEPPDTIDLDAAFSRLAGLPRQKEWEEFVARFQNCGKDESSAEKWKVMTRIFKL